MNKNINLVEILKDCPKGTKLYSTIYGEVEFEAIDKNSNYPIIVRTNLNSLVRVTAYGKHILEYEESGECTLFPSKYLRSWFRFSAPWYKKDRFDPKTLKPFDKVIMRDTKDEKWSCGLFAFMDNECDFSAFICNDVGYEYCIPYNDETKYLIGTKEEEPEYYRYWED